ncbi:MAG: transglycosylase domain-containing protein, partial [Eubacterium sp.]|nr:transglycosylase domain-containing protein [Eubacterium sp.]
MSRVAKKKARKKQNPVSTILIVIVFTLFMAGLIGVGVPLVRMYAGAVKAVSSSNEDTFRQWQTSIVYDNRENEIKKLKGERNVYYLEYDEISDAAKLAIISVEDKNFTHHRGLDVVGLARSVVYLIINRGKITMGGSTITQQLARNVFLSFEQTYSRKLNEIFYAFLLEGKYSKEDILEFYLNNVYFANGNYGIEAASR